MKRREFLEASLVAPLLASWTGSRHEGNLKLLNVPVLKHHDTGGSEITGAVKHFYGLVSMADGNSGARHYKALGETCGRMIAGVRPRHAPDYAGIDRWLTDCMNLVNSLGGIARPAEGIHVGRLTKLESEFRVVSGTVA